MKPSLLRDRVYNHAAIMGVPKAGKSTLAAELLKHGFKLIWISMDGGHTVCYDQGLSETELDRLLDLIIIPDTPNNPVAIHTCLKLSIGSEQFVCHDHSRISCSSCSKLNRPSSRYCFEENDPATIVVWDNCTQLVSSCAFQIQKQMNGGKLFNLEDESDYKKMVDEKFGYSQWRIQGEQIDRFLMNIQAAKYNTIVITHAIEVKGEDGRPITVPYIGTDNFSRNGGKYFNTVVFAEVKNGQHRFNTDTKKAGNAVVGSRNKFDISECKIPTLAPLFDGLDLSGKEVGLDIKESVLNSGAKIPVIKPVLAPVSSGIASLVGVKTNVEATGNSINSSDSFSNQRNSESANTNSETSGRIADGSKLPSEHAELAPVVKKKETAQEILARINAAKKR